MFEIKPHVRQLFLLFIICVNQFQAEIRKLLCWRLYKFRFSHITTTSHTLCSMCSVKIMKVKQVERVCPQEMSVFVGDFIL